MAACIIYIELKNKKEIHLSDFHREYLRVFPPGCILTVLGTVFIRKKM